MGKNNGQFLNTTREKCTGNIHQSVIVSVGRLGWAQGEGKSGVTEQNSKIIEIYVCVCVRKKNV